MAIDILPPYSPSNPDFNPLLPSDQNSLEPRVEAVARPVFQSLEEGVRALLPRVQDHYVAKINGSIHELDELQKTSKKLVDLSKAATNHLQKHKDSKKDVSLSKEILSLCNHLEAKGIKLLSKSELSGTTKVSLERIKELKSLIETEMGQLKSEIQIKFNKTDAQMKELHVIYDLYKEIVKTLDRITKPFIQGQVG